MSEDTFRVKKEGLDFSQEEARNLDSQGGRNIQYKKGLFSNTKTTTDPNGNITQEEINPKKQKKMLANFFDMLAACVNQPLQTQQDEFQPASHTPYAPHKTTNHAAPNFPKINEEEEADEDHPFHHQNDSSDDIVFYDALESEDDEFLAERTRALHQAIRERGSQPTHISDSLQWWDKKLVRSQQELFIKDFCKSIYIRLSPLVKHQHPYAAIVPVNRDREPLNFENNNFRGRLCMRFANVTDDSDPNSVPRTDYFNSRKRLFSLQVQGRMKKAPAHYEDLVGGAWLEKKVKIPSFANQIITFVKTHDPSLVIELDRDPPRVGGPIVQSTMRFSEEPLVDGEIPAWRWGGDVVLLEGDTTDEKESSTLANVRRKNFAQWKDIMGFNGYSTEKSYSFDTFNSYVDFPTMRLVLFKNLGPLGSFGVGSVIEWQKLTMVCFDKKADSEVDGVYYAVEMGWKQGIDHKLILDDN